MLAGEETYTVDGAESVGSPLVCVLPSLLVIEHSSFSWVHDYPDEDYIA